jgi:hypothetical protein
VTGIGVVGLAVWVPCVWSAAPAADAGAVPPSDPCGGASVNECRALAERLNRSEDAEDKARAGLLFVHLCEAGHALSCASAGWREPDPSRRVSLYLKSCDGGYAGACTEIGLLFRLGRDSVRPNPWLARRYYELGCTGGDASACELAAEYYDTWAAPDLTVDKKRARALHRRAHELGWQPPHEAERHAKKLNRTLYCADLKMKGLTFVKGACAGTVVLCEEVARTLRALDSHLQSSTPCKQATGNVWCGQRGNDLVCSAQQPNCEDLLSIAAEQGTRTSSACVPYVRGASDLF